MENHFYHIRCPPLSVTVFITHVRNCVTGATAITGLSELLAKSAYGPRREKTCLRGFANNTGADQPAYPRSRISAFVIRFLENFICKLATGEISIF